MGFESKNANTEFTQYSFQDSRFDIISDGKQKLIRKATNLNNTLAPHWNSIYTEVLQYFQTLVDLNMPIPSLIETTANANSFTFICSFQGDNVMNLLDPNKPQLLLEQEGMLKQVLDILKQAQEGNIYFDPHIKNFVIQNGTVHYVDFTPPWTKNYFDIRLSIANDKERNILIPFFDCMKPQTLGYHFAADFLKMSSQYQSIMPTLFDILSKTNLVEGTFENFLNIANDIMKKEKTRERENTFLL